LIPTGVECLTGDLVDLQAVERAVCGAKLVFHLAARLHLTNPGKELLPAYWRVNVEGTRNIVTACSAASVERLVYFSSVSVYGHRHSGWIDEDTARLPEGIYGETKRAAEDIVLAAPANRPDRALAVVLRFPAIYGARMKGSYPRMVRALSRGIFIPVGPGDNQCTLLYVADAARAALLAAEHPDAAGRVYNVTDGQSHHLVDVIRTVCDALGRKPPRFHLPVGLARSVAQGVDGLAGLAGLRLNLDPQIGIFLRNMTVRGERIQSELGFRASTSLAEGWRQTVAAWRADGTLP
jgi:UDP-glucose 4-epimerase